ncbi:MAG: DUF4194 domain-containing protein [Clostridia bacterium]|nr:DUF4194 domain-containing protein [Clostridia bacterium]
MMESWENWTSGERELFQSTCRRLLRHTFLVRDQDEDSRTRYFFISRTLDAFNEYLGYIGFEVRLDRENGVAMLRSAVSTGEGARSRTGHLNLKKAESLVLCCLWTLYADRVRSGSLKKGLVIRMGDLRLEMEKYGMKELVDKSAMQGILNLFSRYHLIDQKGRMGEEQFQIILYPSLQFAMDEDAFLRFVEAADSRMREKQRDAEEDEDEDEGEEEGGSL